MKKALHYDNVALVPKYSDLNSRQLADTTATLVTKQFKLPVIPSNMKCVIDENKSKWFSENNYMYVMHRFNIDTLEFVRVANVQEWNNISISVGVKEEDHKLIDKIATIGLRVDFITVDIAHGHSALMSNILPKIREKLPNTYIIAGNVCTHDGYDALATWGAHAIKVGIGPGAACTTKLKTGFTYPMYSCIDNIAQNSAYYSETTLIADGGIKHNGDIAKAIHAGADWVMCGKMFSECIDSPSPIDNQGHKLYYGSASTHNKSHSNNVEGTLIALPSNMMTYQEKLNEVQQDLQSSISYAGGNKYRDIRFASAVEIIT